MERPAAAACGFGLERLWEEELQLQSEFLRLRQSDARQDGRDLFIV